MTDIAPPLDEIAAERQRAEQEAYESAGIPYEPAGQEPPAEPETVPEQPTGEEQQTLDTAEPDAPERRRDPDTGQFLPNDPEQDQPFFATYRTREDAERGHAEKDRYIAELQERNRQYEAWVQQQQALAQQAQQQPQTPGNFDELVDENPAYAAQLAYQARDPYAWQRAAEAWEDMSPGAPAMYQMMMEDRQARADLEARLARTEAPLQQQQEQQAQVQAWRELNAEIPGVNDVSDAEFEAAAARNVEWASLITNGQATASQWKTAMRTIYLDAMLARGAIQQNIQDVARTQAQESEQARREAFVASSTTATAQTPATVDQAEQERAEARIRQNQGLWESGWDRPASAEDRLARLRGHDDPERMARFGFRG